MSFGPIPSNVSNSFIKQNANFGYEISVFSWLKGESNRAKRLQDTKDFESEQNGSKLI